MLEVLYKMNKNFFGLEFGKNKIPVLAKLCSNLTFFPIKNKRSEADKAIRGEVEDDKY